MGIRCVTSIPSPQKRAQSRENIAEHDTCEPLPGFQPKRERRRALEGFVLDVEHHASEDGRTIAGKREVGKDGR
jgi:hypothetical protein